MSRWYRAYEGTVTDAKLGEVALVAGCSRSVAIAAWHCILESAAGANDCGRFDATPRRVAVILGEPLATIEAVFSEMRELGMIEDDSVTAWKRRQFQSDTSTERSRKHRETKRNGDATLQERCATPPDTETELSSSLRSDDKRASREQTPNDALAEVLDAERAAAVVEHRKRIRKPLTAYGARQLAKKLAAYGDANAAADAMIANGWQGFEPSWMDNHRPNAAGPPRNGKQTFMDAYREIEGEVERRSKIEGHSGDVVLLPAIGR